MSRLQLIIFGILITFAQFSSACPLGPKETELTLSRVMRNFSRFVMPAENMIQKGRNDLNSATDDDFRAAINGIEAAAECAATVLNDRSGQLLPSRAGDLQGAERTQYLEKFYAHMSDFSSGLLEDDQLLKDQWALSPLQRNFKVLADKAQDIRDRATRAHGDL